MKILKILNSLVLCLIVTTHAQEAETEKIDSVTQARILERVERLRESEFSDFVKELNSINHDMQNFITNEQEACSKLHATQLITKNKLEKEKKRPLSKKEKMYCKLLIVNFQIKLNQKIHEVRVEKLKQRHLEQLQKVESEFKVKIVELEKIAGKLK